jgi:hypothetical protein
MNILEKLMNVFRKRETANDALTDEQKVYRLYLQNMDPNPPTMLEPSHGFGVGGITPVSTPFLELARKASENHRLKIVLSDIKRTKQAIETAKKRKKKTSHLYDRLIDLKAQQLKLEGKK